MMFQTKNDLPEQIRNHAIDVLQKRLFDAIDLMQHAKQAHWNVKGEGFISLHELFDKTHEGVESCADLIAERIAQLGGVTEGTCKVVAKNSSLPDYPLSIIKAQDHIEHLSDSLATFGKLLRQNIEQITQWKDAGTADILTEISRSIDKNLWFVESNLINEKPSKKMKIKPKILKRAARSLQAERLSGH